MTRRTASSPHRAATVPRVAARVLLWALALVALSIPCIPALAQGPAAAGGSQAPTPGELRNADLEAGFEDVRGGHGSVAAGWSPWWIEGAAAQRSQGQLRPPTFGIATRAATDGVQSGAYAQELASEYATHHGGIYQRVAVAPGSVVRFSMWARVWSSSSDDAARSLKPGDYRVSLGIDPYGGTDGSSEHVVWSPEIVEYDTWIKLSVSAVAKGNAVTVFARGACSWRVKHNTSMWDSASLHVTPPAAPIAGASASPVQALPMAMTDQTTQDGEFGKPNVLQNPDFEGAFAERGAGEVAVAAGWHPWWVDGSDGETAEGYLFRPEYKPERRGQGRGRVHAMNAAQKQFTTYATHRAGIYQRVPVTPGSRITFATWAYVWSSAEDDPDVSGRPGDYRVSVGIDPTGGTDGDADSVIWSQARHAYDRWAELTVSAVAQGPAVTVFTRGEPVWRAKHNDAYWDDASLVVEPGGATSAPYAASAVRSDGLVPGKARVLTPAPGGPAAAAGAPPAAAAAKASPPATVPGRRPVGNVPDAARVPRPLGEETSLSYAGPHLSLTWLRGTDGVSIVVRAPQAIDGELALWHQRQEVARWAVAVVPEDPLAIHWPGSGLESGELGVQVRDAQGNVLARCGTVPQ